MALYSYVIPRDFGFAPNPFHGVCTLATCMPKVRETAKKGDWVIGTGSRAYKKRSIGDCIVFAMLVDEVLTFDDYWSDPRFEIKRPNLRASLKYRMGDNIYHREPGTQKWIQEDSHHSEPGGILIPANLKKDTGTTEQVLVARRFIYWGHDAIQIPDRFRNFEGYDVVNMGIGHKCRFPDELVEAFVAWLESLNQQGMIGKPALFID